MIASWNLKEKKIIWDKHNCHLGAIAGEGVTRERPSMARGGGEVQGLGCTVPYSVHTNSTCSMGWGGGVGAGQPAYSQLIDS